jgi:hypothetical protein
VAKSHGKTTQNIHTMISQGWEGMAKGKLKPSILLNGLEEQHMTQRLKK